MSGLGATRLGPSYFFRSLVLGSLNSLSWYVPSSRCIWNSAPVLFLQEQTKDIIINADEFQTKKPSIFQKHTKTAISDRFFIHTYTHMYRHTFIHAHMHTHMCRHTFRHADAWLQRLSHSCVYTHLYAQRRRLRQTHDASTLGSSLHTQWNNCICTTIGSSLHIQWIHGICSLRLRQTHQHSPNPRSSGLQIQFPAANRLHHRLPP